MIHSAALPDNVPYTLKKSILTFIVPAPDGCNLKCPYCYIDRRKEDARSLDLCPSDYASFIEKVVMREEVGAICIQGYEPLLPESFDYTKKILETGKKFEIPTSLVTNGTCLGLWIDELAALDLQKITVSIDAADPSIHDRSRGKIGAFEMTMAGLERAAAHPKLKPILAVGSILMPGKCGRLVKMPEILADLGIRQWVVTMLQAVGKTDIGGAVGNHQKTFQNLLLLKSEAEKYGIRFVVDDEFGTLEETDLDRSVIDIEALRIRRLVNPAGTFRLLPTGQCSVGVDILKEVRPDTPRWVPGEMDAWEFIDNLRREQPAA